VSLPRPGHLIALWAVPRSTSTAFEKTFSCRLDTKIIHEPFTDCYYFGSERRSRRYGDRPDRIRYNTSSALATIFAEPASVTFVKDLCFQAEPYAPRCFLESAINTFMVRDPDAVLASLFPLKPDYTEEEFGFVPLARMWHRVTTELRRESIVVDGDVFRAHPEKILRRYCERIGVRFDRCMLHWQNGAIRKWSDGERDSQAKWHYTLEHSTGIMPPRKPRPQVAAHIRPDIYGRAKDIYMMLSEQAICP
jgi:hypothetical protein